MGGGSYSSSTRSLRSESLGYTTKSADEIFDQRKINNAMDPHGVSIRESRDSAEHPASLATIIGLDVTGSMGSVPHFLVKQGLPDIMDRLIKEGIPDPQVLFLGLGDHTCDRSPLQVAQFESSDELLDKWLTSVWLEGGGGANLGESYLLAWYFAAYHTAIDCFEKRNQKGFLFTIGDEPTLKDISSKHLHRLMGPGQYEDFTSAKLLEEASKKYHVFHIHIKSTRAGSISETISGWKQLLQDGLIVANKQEDVADIISSTILKFSKTEKTETEDKQEAIKKPDQEIIL